MIYRLPYVYWIIWQNNRQVYTTANNAYHDNMAPANGIKFSIDELKEIVRPIAKEYGVKKVYLFGSVARGDYDEESDYDFCIDRGKIACIFKLSAFHRDLSNAIGYDIDVVTTKGAERRPEILKTILEEGVVIYG